eukprot:m.48862 g.48862  ORF g.48862 m.48862 type:complete len:88 (+) comp33934_c0_seq3:27-290(+)
MIGELIDHGILVRCDEDSSCVTRLNSFLHSSKYLLPWWEAQVTCHLPIWTIIPKALRRSHEATLSSDVFTGTLLHVKIMQYTHAQLH